MVACAAAGCTGTVKKKMPNEFGSGSKKQEAMGRSAVILPSFLG